MANRPLKIVSVMLTQQMVHGSPIIPVLLHELAQQFETPGGWETLLVLNDLRGVPRLKVGMTIQVPTPWRNADGS